MPKVELEALPIGNEPGRVSAMLGPLGDFESRSVSGGFGLKNLGANVETLAPGSASSHRHWHSHVDEIVVVLSGELVLVEDDEETALAGGDIAVFPAGAPNGHCLRNVSDVPARFFVVASCDVKDRCHYAEADLVAEADGKLCRADGTVVS